MPVQYGLYDDDRVSASSPATTQDTSDAARQALEIPEHGSEFQRKPPQYLKDIIREINRIRLELSQLYTERYGKGSDMPMGEYNAYPQATLEDLETDARMEELRRKEKELWDEYRATKFYAATSDSGEPYRDPSVQQVGGD